MSRKLHLPGPAMVVALVALFVALSGTAIAAGVPALAKRALVADNAKKLGGQTSAQLLAKADSSAKQAAESAASAAASQPGPASTIAGLITIKTAPFSLGGQQGNYFTATCDAGQKAVSGGYDNPVGIALGWDSKPTSDGTGWTEYLSSSSGGSGVVYAICVK